MTAELRRIHLDGAAYWDLGGRLIPVLAGAEDPLFPEVPEDLSTLSRDDLDALFSLITERAAIVSDPAAEGRSELVGALSVSQVVEVTTAALDARDRITAQLTALDEAETADADALAALAARAQTDDEPEADAEGDEDETETGDEDDAETTDDAEADAAPADAEVEVAVAGAMPTADEIAAAVIRAAGQAAAPRRARTPARHRPRQGGRGGGPASTVSIVASGEQVTERGQLAQVVSERLNGYIGQPATDGQKVVLARRTVEYPEDRQIGKEQREVEGVLSRFLSREALTGPQAVTAAGGICAPPEPLYDVETFATDDRPVRDALPTFNATRGGITYRRPSTMGVMTAAAGVMTADEDAEITDGVPDNEKSCLRIECPELVTAEVEAIYKCVTVGNFGARTWPEDVAHNLDLASAEWARLAETQFLNVIKTSSTALTHASQFGAMIDLVGAVLKARAGMISRHRMSTDQRFRVILPFWVSEALPLDQLRGGRPDLARAAVQAKLESYGVSVTWSKDGVTGGTGQVFGAQSAGALTDFPADVQWAFFPEGSFIALDNGVLDLGLVRDSALNATNDYQLFMESFEKVAYRGIESLWLTSTVCYSGQVQIAGSVLDCAYNVEYDSSGS